MPRGTKTNKSAHLFAVQIFPFLFFLFTICLFACSNVSLFSFFFSFLSWRFGIWDPRSISILEKRRLDSF